MRHSFDFAPYRRSMVGFDRFFDLLETGMRGDAAESYPPFDILKEGEDSYRVTLAVAGFRPENIEIVVQQNSLTVSGKRAEAEAQGDYLHRGIATNAFQRRFQLADFIEAGNATFENGLLTIELKRVVPEAMKPRRVEIASGPQANHQIEQHREQVRDAA
ncbi:Hsp20 family protein [Altererythrobacter xixiisoli]|uniref:Hsp20 family protein n=1 Tax=Croceibacterium xixiisoli TaxID=1476466 RepID=A0A6I4U0T8_9SPHN|nr:Hsp20 family protein [Croceibacterium xixiisoli]MXP00479.1 Hsp20 family protein [Croceibacterium xixiisoli]